MVVVETAPMTFLRWVLYACFLCSSWGLKTVTQSCDPNDMLALKEFAGKLTNGSIITSWSSKTDCCQWEGVVCGSNTNGSIHSRVTMLILSKKGLQGLIPPSLGRLDKLKSVNLSCNQLSGGLPLELSSLKQLEVLDLSHNLLSGQVSGVLSGLLSIRTLNISSNLFKEDLLELGGYPNLVVFNMSNNSFTGRITSQICSSSKGIQILDLSANHLVGDLEGLSNCSRSLQQLRLDSNSLSGALPDFLYSMSALQQFSISNNNFSGQLSKEVSKLFNLKNLVIYGNRFSGHIPNAFVNLTYLEQFDAHSNMLSGPLPSTLSLCSKLHILDLRNNSLTGPIDLNFTGMPSLWTLDLALITFLGQFQTLYLLANELTGKIPESFANLSSLLFLSLSNNSFVDLSGALTVLQQCQNLSTLILTKNFVGEEIPRNVSGFQNLMVLAFGNCALKGQIPFWLLSCRKLEVLDLSWNHLDGSIPNWIGQMENLFYLDFSNNSLTGEIPQSLTQLKSLISANNSSPHLTASAGIPLYVKRNQSASGLQYNQASSFPPSILLSNNRINGTIPPEVGRLKDLHVFDLSRNNIMGTIPSSFSEMENLEILDLSSNNLYGSIPPSLEKLTFLSKFSVANNHLRGQIPTGGQFYSFPSSSFEGNPGLCGVIVSPCNVINNMMSNILSITITVGVGLVLVLAIFLHKMLRRNVGDPICDLEEEVSMPHRLSEALRSSKLVLFQNADCKDLTVADLLKSTNNFNQATSLVVVGSAWLSGDCGQMEREFQAEVEALSRAQHKNLVSLQGYCRHGNDRLLIYSYMENGSLDYWLHESVDGVSVLEWEVRLKIAQGAAWGLAYLHKVCEPHIVHRDVKSSNILLDEKFEAHLADFGLSRLLCPYDTHVTTDLPTLMATCRGDVYSFGVVLLELLTGRRPVEVCKGKNCRNLVSWVFQMKSEKREAEIIDPAIWGKDRQKQLFEMLEIACRCLDQDPRRRPLVEEVVSWLDGIGFQGAQQ
ncbi:phytosylfokine-alpha receptor [Salix suchowensis]|nr:phytosylfokine-alpha receptor [Salix suchowensis]